MSTECLIPLVFVEAADKELELAYAPGFLEYLMSPAPGDVQSLGEVVKDCQLMAALDCRELNSEPVLISWLAQILLD